MRRQEDGTGMADLRVDYELLASIHRTLGTLTRELGTVEDRVSAYSTAFGSGAITAAMGSFSGNWSQHHKRLIGTMEHLGHMIAATEREFHRTDSQLASDLAEK
jgi:hypothetical protein